MTDHLLEAGCFRAEFRRIGSDCGDAEQGGVNVKVKQTYADVDGMVTQTEVHMRHYEIRYEVVGSGAGIVTQVVQAASDMNARNLVYAQFRGQTVRIYGSRQVG